jgi:hypothetical protein
LNKRNGYGKFRYSDGSEYYGSWKENLRHGKGKIKKTNGDYMDCEFENDKRSGEVVGQVGNYEIKAQMLNEKLHGSVKIISPHTSI